MTSPTRDRWAEWLLDVRFGGDAERADAVLRRLGAVRDRVLDGADVREGDVVLDVGAGDGLIAFAALARIGRTGRVVFSDVSSDLLDHARTLATELGVLDRTEFVQAAAQDLAPLADGSVDVVTTRSVVIYVPASEKPRAFQEFFRILRPGGRLSMFEPINKFGCEEREDPASFMGLDTSAVADLTSRIKAVYEERAPGERTLIDFDERDLLAFAERAGFAQAELDYEARVHRGAFDWDAEVTWDTFLRSSGNPCAPTLAEVLEEALTPEERRRFEDHVRPLFEARVGNSHSAVAYLRARKADAR